MSLDKLLGTKPVKKTEKPKPAPKKIDPIPNNKEGETPKVSLKCTEKGCKHTRILRKKTLSSEDFVCKKCGGHMVESKGPKKNGSESEDD